MAYSQFPDEAFFIQLTDNETIPLGKIRVDENMELSNIMLNVQKVGIHSSESLTLEIHTQEYVDTPIYTSDSYTYDDFDITASHWAGFINFDFDNCPLSDQIDYWVKIKVENYVYSDDVRYIAVQLDWPEPVNTPDNASYPAAAMGIYGYVNA